MDSGSATPLGRIKAPPTYQVNSIKNDPFSIEKLSKMCCSDNDTIVSGHVSSLGMSSFISLASNPSMHCMCLGKCFNSGVPSSWESTKQSILQRTTSRNGREYQRFSMDTTTGRLFRLTTGCVPIMASGKILLVSSSRKQEWILPKGGWESDETCEASAMRESFEEGGLLGTIGPKLTDVEYETRKAKKRRFESDAAKKTIEASRAIIDASYGIYKQSNRLKPSTSGDENLLHRSHISYSMQQGEKPCACSHVSTSRPTETSSSITFSENNKCSGTQIRESILSQKICCKRLDEATSVASTMSISSVASSSCTHIRMSMFPLYVLEVRENWPESGRARKVVDIDIAIEMMKLRPEFQKVLIEVKEKGYHTSPHTRPRLIVKSTELNLRQEARGARSMRENNLLYKLAPGQREYENESISASIYYKC